LPVLAELPDRRINRADLHGLLGAGVGCEAKATSAAP